MNRDQRKDSTYWEHCTTQKEELIVMGTETLRGSGVTREYDSIISFGLSRHHCHLMLSQYSRGDAVGELGRYFFGLLQAWEESYRLSREVNHEKSEFPWKTKAIGCYQTSFLVIGLALSLNIPDDQWQRLLALIGNEGEDILLDRIISTRQPERKIGTTLCHPKPYARLLAAIDAPPKQQARKLAAFVDNWYRELKRCNSDNEPYWYNYHECPDEWCNYFGYWCVEAVAAVKAFGLDDSLCLGHPHYPGDLLRPEGPTTHLPCSESVLTEALEKPRPEAKKEQPGSCISRWYHGLCAEIIEALGKGKQVKKGKNK